MIYWDLVRFSFLRFFSYPFEIIAQTLKRAMEVIFLIIFWSIYAQSTNQSISIPQISAYFLIAMGVADLTMARWGAFSNLIGNLVKSGQLSNYIIKPADLVWSLYALALGRNGLRLLLAFANIIIGFCVMPPKSLLSIAMFILFFIFSWFISFAYNLFEGTLFLHFTDASGIRNSLENFIRVFTGVMIPLYLFPSPFKEILRVTPFPFMVYGPTNAINITSINGDVITDIMLGIFWSLVTYFSMIAWWHHSMKKYEAVGI